MPVTNRTIPKVIEILKEEYKRFIEPVVSEIAYNQKASPFRVLISPILLIR